MRRLFLSLARCMPLVAAVTCSRSNSILLMLLMQLKMCQLGKTLLNSKNIQCLESLECIFPVSNRLIIMYHQVFRKHLKILLILEAIIQLAVNRRAICLVVLKGSLSQATQTTIAIILNWIFQRMETPSCSRAWKALEEVENSHHKNLWSSRPLWMSLGVVIHRSWVLPRPSSCPITLMKWRAILSTPQRSDTWSWPIDNTDRAWGNLAAVSNNHQPLLISQ